MTNTTQTTIDAARSMEGQRAMQAYIEFTQLVVQARIRARGDEAASERLAAIARRSRDSRPVRRQVGRLLILAGRRIAGESAQAGSPAGSSRAIAA